MAGKLKWLGKWLDAPSFVDQHQLPHGNRARLFQGPVSQETLIFYSVHSRITEFELWSNSFSSFILSRKLENPSSSFRPLRHAGYQHLNMPIRLTTSFIKPILHTRDRVQAQQTHTVVQDLASTLVKCSASLLDLRLGLHDIQLLVRTAQHM